DVLERRAAPGALVDAAPPPGEREGEASTVQAAAPAQVSGRVVLLRPLALQQRLGPAVAPLLLDVGAQRAASVVPDERRRAEAERPAELLQTPADVHVVAGGPKPGIEAVDQLEAGPSERRVAA